MKQAFHERGNSVADRSTDAVIVIDHVATIMYANDIAERMFGYGTCQLIGPQRKGSELQSVERENEGPQRKGSELQSVERENEGP